MRLLEKFQIVAKAAFLTLPLVTMSAQPPQTSVCVASLDTLVACLGEPPPSVLDGGALNARRRADELRSDGQVGPLEAR